jgi:hypothetical protein
MVAIGFVCRELSKADQKCDCHETRAAMFIKAKTFSRPLARHDRLIGARKRMDPDQ